MKFTVKIKLSAAALLVGYGTMSLGNEPSVPANHPCGKIEAACTAAGFIKHRHKEGKGLWKDCMQPIVSGQSVAGVTVDPNDVKGCQEKRAAKKAAKPTK